MVEPHEISRIKRGIERVLVGKGATRKEARDRVNRIAAKKSETSQIEGKSDE